MTFGRLRAACYSGTAVVLGILLLALTAVTFTDVVGRYLFSAPLPGGPELTELLVMAVVFGGLPALCLDDGHITADLVTQRLGPQALVVQLFLARLASAAVLGLAAWQLWKIGLRLAGYGQTTVFLKVPLGPVAQAASVICGVSALLVLAMIVMRVERAK
ncbi:MAG: TRAP transporter small permease [Rhodobacterales bacterium]|nr:TRAP transporter small permease [Rhodobacterales bacterium]MDX5500126.1 TRAP transporter small permease [Rhodobacterales bacterium]